MDGSIYLLEEEINLDKNIKHNIRVVVDRLVLKDRITSRLTDSIETAVKLAEGLVIVDTDGKEQLFSTNYSCPYCGWTLEEITPRLFSFNAPYGACPTCLGLGVYSDVSEDLILKDGDLSINQGLSIQLAGVLTAEGLLKGISRHCQKNMI